MTYNPTVEDIVRELDAIVQSYMYKKFGDGTEFSIQYNQDSVQYNQDHVYFWFKLTASLKDTHTGEE